MDRRIAIAVVGSLALSASVFLAHATPLNERVIEKGMVEIGWPYYFVGWAYYAAFMLPITIALLSAH